MALQKLHLCRAAWDYAADIWTFCETIGLVISNKFIKNMDPDSGVFTPKPRGGKAPPSASSGFPGHPQFCVPDVGPKFRAIFPVQGKGDLHPLINPPLQETGPILQAEPDLH